LISIGTGRSGGTAGGRSHIFGIEGGSGEFDPEDPQAALALEAILVPAVVGIPFPVVGVSVPPEIGG
jgi:hypothetical protein